MIDLLSSLILPLLLLFCALLLFFHKKPLYEELELGIREGERLTLSIFPSLLLLSVGTSMLSASGFPALLSAPLAPLFGLLGIPRDALPLILLRPFSGSGSTALLEGLFSRYGADSEVGTFASVFAGSSDTFFYVVSLYFSSVGLKRGRYALPLCALTMLLSLLLSAAVCRLFGL